MGSNRLRVLEVIEATTAGTKRHVLDILAGFAADRKIAVEVVCPLVRSENHGDTSFVADARALGVPMHILPMVREIDPRRDLSALWGLTRLVRAGHFDVVHAHGSKAGALGRAAAFLAAPALGRRPRTVYTPHGFAFLMPGSQRRERMYTTIERVFGQWATDTLVVVSEDERREALDRAIAPAERIRLVRNSVDPAWLPTLEEGERKREELGWGPRGETVVVGSVGRLSDQKDPVTWVRAAAQAIEKREDLRFVWIGVGELEEPARALAQQLLGSRAERIEFLGYRTDARAIIAALDLFCLSSLFEGLPYVLIEAMALERPVVATDCTGIRDLVRDGTTGALVPPTGPEPLAERILALAADPEARARLGAAGRAHALTITGIDRQLATIRGIYWDLGKEIGWG